MMVDIQPHEEEALLRVVGIIQSPHDEFDSSRYRIRSGPDENMAIRDYIVQPFPTPAVASLGNLSSVPIELITAIFLQADISTLFRLRQVNRLARIVASNIRQYRDIATYALGAFRAVLRTRIAIHFTIIDLHASLCAPDCQRCGQFATMLYLPNLKRCCFECDTPLDLEIAVLVTSSDSDMRSEAGVRPTPPIVRTVPGTYTWNMIPHAGGRVLVNKVAMMAVCPSWSKLVDAEIDQEFAGGKASSLALTGFPYLNPVNGQIEDGFWCEGCQINSNKLGQACENDTNGDPFYDDFDEFLEDGSDILVGRAFTRKDFLAHLQLCAEAKKLWRGTRGGTVPFDWMAGRTLPAGW